LHTAIKKPERRALQPAEPGAVPAADMRAACEQPRRVAFHAFAAALHHGVETILVAAAVFVGGHQKVLRAVNLHAFCLEAAMRMPCAVARKACLRAKYMYMLALFYRQQIVYKTLHGLRNIRKIYRPAEKHEVGGLYPPVRFFCVYSIDRYGVRVYISCVKLLFDPVRDPPRVARSAEIEYD
jgi:hypothetical protein